MKKLRVAVRGAALVVAALISQSVLAGAADVSDSSGNQLKFEYAGKDRIRVNTQSAGNYMLILGEKAYAVSDQEGQTMVMDLGQTYRMFRGQVATTGPAEAAGKFVSLKRTSGSSEVAGVVGEHYDLTYIDDTGAEKTSQVVLSTDKRAREFTDAILGMTGAMAKIMDQEQRGSQDLYDELQSRGVGVLKWGDSMHVTAISDRAIDDARFTLPAEPTDLGSLGNLFGGGAKPAAEENAEEQSSGGMFSRMMGALGGSAEETPDTAQDGGEEDADQPTDDAIGNAVNKAFGKIFGE